MRKSLALYVEHNVVWEAPLDVDAEIGNEEVLLLVQNMRWQDLFPDEPPKDWQNLKMEIREYE